MTIKDFDYEQLVIRYIHAKQCADRFYSEAKQIEEEMKRRFNQKLEQERSK